MPRPETTGARTGLFVGRTVLDVIQLLPAAMPANGKIGSLAHAVTAGGPSTNAAVLFAALGGDATLVSRIADDPLGAAVLADLAEHGCGRLRHHNVWRFEDGDACVPSSIIVDRDTGNRSVAVADPSGVGDTGEHDPAGVPLVRSDLGVVMVDSGLTDVSIPVTRRARELGVPTVLDCGARKKRTPQQLPFIDAGLVSEDHAPEKTVDAAVQSLQDAGVPFGAVTCGERPLRWYTPEGEGEIVPPKVVTHDTLGAGDFFHGAYSFAIARTGLDAEGHVAALTWASTVSALSVQHFGPRDWLDHLAELAPAPGSEH